PISASPFILTPPAPSPLFPPPLHAALPISAVDHHSPAHIDTHMGDARRVVGPHKKDQVAGFCLGAGYRGAEVIKPLGGLPSHAPDRKSTRLNSSHVSISYAVFCLKKENSEE